MEVNPAADLLSNWPKWRSVWDGHNRKGIANWEHIYWACLANNKPVIRWNGKELETRQKEEDHKRERNKRYVPLLKHCLVLVLLARMANDRRKWNFMKQPSRHVGIKQQNKWICDSPQPNEGGSTESCVPRLREVELDWNELRLDWAPVVQCSTVQQQPGRKT